MKHLDPNELKFKIPIPWVAWNSPWIIFLILFTLRVSKVIDWHWLWIFGVILAPAALLLAYFIIGVIVITIVHIISD